MTTNRKNVEQSAQMTPELIEAQKLAMAPGWRPVPGDVLTGKIASMSVRTLPPIGEQPKRNILVLTLATDNGYTAVHVMHSVLNAAINNLRPTKGDMISIAYHGKVQPEDDERPAFHNYTVSSPNSADTPFNWDLLS